MMQEKFSIGIIGGTGGIGQWFARFFAGEGYQVYASGRKTGLSLQQMTRICSVVIVAVPIGDTVDVIEKVGPLVTREALLMDLTSLKQAPVEAMLRSSASEVIGMHPLFGPDVPSLADQNVILCPARTERWLPWITGLLEDRGARVTMAEPEKHDEMMSLVQVLNHLNSLALGLALRESGASPEELDRFSTPIFRTKRAILERIFSKNPRLYAELIACNPNAHRILALYSRGLTEISDLVEKNDTEGLIQLIKS